MAVPSEDRSKIIEGLGNLSVIKTRTGSRQRVGTTSELFIPIVNWEQAEQVVSELLDGNWPTSKEKSKAITDLRGGRWLDNKDLTVNSLEEFRERVKDLLMSNPYDELWKAAHAKEPLIPVFERIIDRPLTKQTMHWKLKKLLNWAKSLEILPKRRYPYN